MQPDDRYTDKRDNFSREVGEKLRKHLMPVDSDVWESLAGKLPLRKKRIPVKWGWAWVAVGAAVAALLFLLLLLPDIRTTEPLLTQSDTKRQITAPDSIEDPEKTIPPDETPITAETSQTTEMPRTNEKSRLVKTSRTDKTSQSAKTPGTEETSQSAKISRTEEVSLSAETSLPEEVSPKEEASLPEEVSPTEEASLSAKLTQPEKTPLSEEKRQQEETPVQADASRPEEIPQHGETLRQQTADRPEKTILPEKRTMPEARTSGRPVLIAALGSGGSLPDFSLFEQDANLVYDNPIPGGDYNNGENSGNQYNLLTPNDYSDIEHRPPVSFSLTVDLPIGAKTSIETGLSYTYLFSRFRRNDNLIYRGTLQQHYIGVPVNLRYGIWKNDLWNIYLFGGGSMEKGIRSIYKQEIEQNGSIVFHTNVYSGISGFQFSAQGGAGFSYRLHNNLYLFGEPKLIYYFRNNQPMSARTENPFVFGLNMGIRIRFNSE